MEQDPAADVVEQLERLHALDARPGDPSRAGSLHRDRSVQSAVAVAAAGLLSLFVAVEVSDLVSVFVLPELEEESEDEDEERLSVR